MDKEILKATVYCITFIVAFVIFVFSASKGWLKKISFGKTGVAMEGAEIRQKRSGALNKLLDDQINGIDYDVKDYSIKTILVLHDNLLRYLNFFIPVRSIQRNVSCSVRQVLIDYTLQLKDNFKVILRPECFVSTIESIMMRIRREIAELAKDDQIKICHLSGEVCFVFPVLQENFYSLVRERITHDWALPLRNYQLISHEKKITLYEQFIPSFMELGDKVKAETSRECIEKNKKYKEALERIPERGEL